MILKDNFFTIENQNIALAKAEYRIKLNLNHFIFKAHFPDNPITPGVCIVQIVKEIYSYQTNKTFFLNKIKNMKFSRPVIPTENEQITVMISNSSEDNKTHKLKVEIIDNDILFTKMNMILTELT
jgi:3-hydroxyacyl-[acyl-carrier-protein] dehydratase